MSLTSDKQAQQAQNADSLYYLAPLNGFAPKDMTACVSDINEQLTVFSKDINSLSQIASSPVNGNLFASVSATGMLLDKLSDSPASGKDYSALAIDLLGCLTGEDAQTATVLRPILHKVRDACLRQPKNSKDNPLKASDIKLFDDHMHTLKAGELKTLIEKSQAKLSSWLTQAGSLGKDSLQALIQPATPAESAKQPAPVSSNSGKNWYAPDKTYPSIWQALQSVTKQEKAKPDTTNVASAASTQQPTLL